MDNESAYKTLRYMKKDIEAIIVRDYIRASISNFKEDKIYIIYDGKEIAEYDESIMQLKKDLNEIKSYYISKPVKSLLR